MDKPKAPELVDYAKFVALSGSDLCHYMEPLVLNPGTKVSIESLELMLAELSSYDEYHLVYALMLGSRILPEKFVPQLQRFVTHVEGSVRCAVLHIVDELPSKYVTQELIDSVRRAHPDFLDSSWVEELLNRLETRLSDSAGKRVRN